MRTPDFLNPQAQKMAMEAVRHAEAHTAAEIVVNVHRESGNYRAADFLFGFLCALATMTVLIFHPAPFAEDLWPVEVAAAFVLGCFICAFCPPLRRILTPPSTQVENVHRAARSTFFDMGVFKTRESVGVLVYVSLFEKRVEVVCDKGVDSSRLGAEWQSLVQELQHSVRGRGGFKGFLIAVRAMGPALGRILPRRADDVNELPDEVSVS